MNTYDRASLKMCEEMSSTTATRLVARDGADKHPKPDSRSVALYIKLHEIRRVHNICRRLLGRAHLL
ncbi:MAG: hypothetical protein JO108_00255 [Acidobacteriaceae bacterium]|nr:hypothetical protein [Acidobacteriaceae bacterium]